MSTTVEKRAVIDTLSMDDICPYCGGVLIESIEQADVLGVAAIHTSSPCSHLIISQADARALIFTLSKE